MPKLKSHRGAAKRFKRTGGGRIRRRHALMRHILTSKTRKRKRRLRRSGLVSEADQARTEPLLPY
ncbi:MAG: 50S ribosomal protein L35 [Terriglobia bacterium]